MELTRDIDSVVGKVEFVNYPREEDEEEQRITKWRAFRISTKEFGPFGVSGIIGWRPKVNESLKLTRGNRPGRDDGYFLYQGKPSFRFKIAEHDIPVNERGVLHQVCEITLGIGPSTEQKIWDAKGDNWRDVTSDDVKISAGTLAKFHEAIQHIDSCKARTEAIAFLLDIGCTDNMAAAAWDKWQEDTISKVQANPYILSRLMHYGFSEIDTRIAPRFGITKDDARRVSACTKYTLNQLCDSATVAYWSVLCDKIISTIPDAAPSAIESTIRYMLQSGKLAAFDTNTPNPKVALAKNFNAEREIFNYVTNDSYSVWADINTENMDVTLDESQMEAVCHALSSRFCIINGGAGSGKTTIIRAIADSLGECDTEICAFAGKAAARLRERTHHHASTIHSMLFYKGEVLGFTRTSLRGVSVIVDEASMVNSELMAEIVKREPTRLILVGDEAQLPPVGAGSPFHDLIRLMPEAVSTLTTCYRNKEAVYQAAMAVRNAKMPVMFSQTEKELWEFRATGNDYQTHNAILKAVIDGQIDFSQDVVLVCRNGDSLDTFSAVLSLNVAIKQIVNPAARGDDRPLPRQLDAGDRVICTENDPDNDVWNGTTGRIDTFDVDGSMYVELDSPNSEGETSVMIEKKKVKNWSLAYALTVHKSQGSQYRKVYFVCLLRDTHMLLDRSMLYTAMTRATEECHAFGQLPAMRMAINKAEIKLTCLQEFFK